MTSSSEPLKVEIVGHVNSNYSDAWRTRQDYIDDQRQQRNLVRLQSGTLLVAVFGLLVSSYFQFLSSKEQQTVVVEVIHKHIAAPSASASVVNNEKPPSKTPASPGSNK